MTVLLHMIYEFVLSLLTDEFSSLIIRLMNPVTPISNHPFTKSCIFRWLWLIASNLGHNEKFTDKYTPWIIII